jgi:tRNA(Ile2) C34 agmatinyltransferase TiaS
MNLLNFTTIYSDEANRKAKWKKYWDRQGVICLHCGSHKHYWKKGKENYECKQCSYRHSLKASTVMHGSQLSYQISSGITLSNH